MNRWALLSALALGAAALTGAAVSFWTGWMPGDAANAPAATSSVPSTPGGDATLSGGLPPGASYEELVQHLRRQPRDGRALVFKARLDMLAQRFELAAAGYEKALQVTPNVARDASVWVEYAEARAMAQGGTLAGPPEELLAEALRLDANHAQALDLAGSAAWERGDYAQARDHWTLLLAQTPATSPRHAALTAAIERAASRARVSLPPKR